MSIEFVWLVLEGDRTVAVCDTQANAYSWIDGYIAFNCQWEPEGSGKYAYMRNQYAVSQQAVLNSIP